MAKMNEDMVWGGAFRVTFWGLSDAIVTVPYRDGSCVTVAEALAMFTPTLAAKLGRRPEEIERLIRSIEVIEGDGYCIVALPPATKEAE